MGLNLRLLSLKLRQTLNFRLVKLLLLLFYLAATASFVIYHFAGTVDPAAGEYEVEQTAAGQSVRDRFLVVGGMTQDFRQKDTQNVSFISRYTNKLPINNLSIN